VPYQIIVSENNNEYCVVILKNSTKTDSTLQMVWTIDHDVLLLREILVLRPFAFKFGSRERGQAWDKIAATVNTLQQVRFSVDQRGVRERYAKLEKAYKRE